MTRKKAAKKAAKRSKVAGVQTRKASVEKPATGEGSRPLAAASATPPPNDPEKLFYELPPKQQAFIVNYLANGFNATKAAQEAGYSAKTADSQASRMLKDVKVAAVIAARSKATVAKAEISAERVIEEIARLAFLDPRRLFTADGRLKEISELDEDVAAAIAGIEVKVLYDEGAPIGELKKIKFADKGINLERLARYFKLFKDTLKVEVFDLAALVREARERANNKP